MLPFLLLAVLPLAAVALELRHVQAIWRHGDRAPKRLPYPLDEHTEAAWPNGWAQLTDLGVQQMEELGAFFRSEYAGSFVDARFDRREVFVRSSDSERALVSASAFLDGLFPPADRRHAPPVHGSPPTRRDPLLKPSDFDCPQYEEETRRLNAPLDASLQWKYRELLSFLGVHTGYGPNISLKEASGLNDLNRELAHQLPQPPWVHRRWSQFGGNTTLELVTEMKRARRVADFDKPPLFRLRGGFLLADWLRRTSGAARERAEKMVLYSSHDGTLQALLHALGVADGQQIPYAACLIFELHRDEAGSHFVRLLYRSEGRVHVRRLRGCAEFCPLPTALRLLRPLALPSREALLEACGLEDSCTRPKGKKKEKKRDKKKAAKRPSSKLVDEWDFW